VRQDSWQKRQVMWQTSVEFGAVVQEQHCGHNVALYCFCKPKNQPHVKHIYRKAIRYKVSGTR
jgi:hypothetical protein